MQYRNLTYFSPTIAALLLLLLFRNESVRQMLLVINTAIGTAIIGSLFMFGANISSRTNWIRPFSRGFSRHAKMLPNSGLIFLLLIAFSPHHKGLTTPTEQFMHHPVSVAIRVVLFIGIISWIYFSNLYHQRFYFPKRLQARLVVVAFLFLNLLPFDLLLPSIKGLHSTLISWYILSGALTAGTALATFEIMRDKKRRIHKSTRLILGTYLFALSCFRAYLAYSQDFLIWYSNLPYETPFLSFRSDISWLFRASLVLNYLIPMVALFTRNGKKSSKNLTVISATIMVGYAIDIYVLVHPQPVISALISFEIFVLAAVLFGWLYFSAGKLKLSQPIYIVPLLLLVISSPSCTTPTNKSGYYYTPDMHHTTAIKPYATTKNTPVKGTFCRENPITPLNKNRHDRALSSYVYINKALPDTSVINGRQLYAIYCMPCHGKKGNGKGPLVTSGKFIYPPKNLTRKAAISFSNGQLYHDITVGYNLMGAHGSMLTSDERWAVVKYVRKLQGEARQ